MKPLVDKTIGCGTAVGTVDFNRSDAEQIDRAENEGMTVRIENIPTEKRSAFHLAKTGTLELRVLAFEQFLRSLISSQASVADRIWPTPRTRKARSAKVTTDAFQIRNRNGIWEVTEDGHFYGDYVREDVAIKAVEKARQQRFLG